MKGYSLDQSTELWKYLYLKLTVNKKFQRLRHIQPDFDILFVKLTAQIGDKLH